MSHRKTALAGFRWQRVDFVDTLKGGLSPSLCFIMRGMDYLAFLALIAAWAALRRAMGTRKGLQET